MEELEQVYLLASFPDEASLKRAAETIDLPVIHRAVLGGEGSGAAEIAASLELDGELEEDIDLPEVQAERLAWHLDNDARPILAVRVMAAEGREMNQRLSKLGGEILSAPEISAQANDVDYDPGMENDGSDQPPNEDRIFAPN